MSQLKTSTRHNHEVVCVQASSLAPVEAPEDYAHVPRHLLRNDGVIRPLSPPALEPDQQHKCPRRRASATRRRRPAAVML